LIKIAAAASGKGVRVTGNKASGKQTEDLVRIAAAGKGCVFFDLAN
jgi:DNA replication protein